MDDLIPQESPVLVMRSNDKSACLLAFWCLAMNLARVPLFSELGRNQEASGAARWRDIAECSAGVARPYRGGADGTAAAITCNSEGTFLVGRRHK